MATDKPSPETESPYRRLALGVAAVAGVVAVILRIVPHQWNFSSVGAVGLFGGARVRAWHAYLLPLGVMVVSDLILWVLNRFDPDYSLLHSSRIYVYGSFMIYVLIGRWLRDRNSVAATTMAAMLGGLQFFILTNFCTWLFQPFDVVSVRYSRDLAGLMACFAAALPFYPAELSDSRLYIVWTVLGDILFTTIYLQVYAKLAQRATQTEPAPVPATNA